MSSKKRTGKNNNKNDSVPSYKSLVVNLLVGAVCFYAGIGVGVRVDVLDCNDRCAKQQGGVLGQSDGGGSGGGGGGGEERILKSEMNAICAAKVEEICGGAKGAMQQKAAEKAATTSNKSTGNRFPDNVRYFATGVSVFFAKTKSSQTRCLF